MDLLRTACLENLLIFMTVIVTLNTVPLTQVNTVAAPSLNQLQTNKHFNSESNTMNETSPTIGIIGSFEETFGNQQSVQVNENNNIFQQSVQGKILQYQGVFLPTYKEKPLQKNFQDLDRTVNG